MGKVSIVILFAAALVGVINAQHYIDNVLMVPRQEYASAKWNSFEAIDANFNRAYSSLNSTVYSCIDFFLKQQPLITACQSFNPPKLSKTVRTSLRATCESLSATISQAVPRAQSSLMMFFVGFLGSHPDLMEKAQEMFSYVQTALNNLVPLYENNRACVIKQLPTFTNTYRVANIDIFNLYQRMQFSVSKIFSNTSTASRIAMNSLSSFRTNLVNCNNRNDVDDCVAKLVKTYRDCGNNCESIYEIVMEPLKRMSDATSDFIEMLKTEMTKASQEVKSVKKNLDVWLESAGSCSRDNIVQSSIVKSSMVKSSDATTSTTSTTRTLTSSTTRTLTRASPTYSTPSTTSTTPKISTVTQTTSKPTQTTSKPTQTTSKLTTRTQTTPKLPTSTVRSG